MLAPTFVIKVCESDSGQPNDSVSHFLILLFAHCITNNPPHLSTEHSLRGDLSSHPCFFLMYSYTHRGAGVRTHGASGMRSERKRLAGGAAIPFLRECLAACQIRSLAGKGTHVVRPSNKPFSLCLSSWPRQYQ